MYCRLSLSEYFDTSLSTENDSDIYTSSASNPGQTTENASVHLHL